MPLTLKCKFMMNVLNSDSHSIWAAAVLCKSRVMPIFSVAYWLRHVNIGHTNPVTGHSCYHINLRFNECHPDDGQNNVGFKVIVFLKRYVVLEMYYPSVVTC